MKSNVWLWRTLAAVTLGCTLLLLAGFGWALRELQIPAYRMELPESASPPAASGGDWSEKTELAVAALGDSLTVGTGDATGAGYVRNVTGLLARTRGIQVRLLGNLAINGLTGEQLVKRLDERGYRNVLRQADLILLSVGGNDLFQIAGNGGSLAEGGDLSPERALAGLPKAKARLQEVFRKLRDINPVARIVYVGLYNPFYDLPQMRPASAIIQDWNAHAHRLAAEDGNASVVPTYDLFEASLDRYLSSDHFHPNQEGYVRIAERIVQALP